MKVAVQIFGHLRTYEKCYKNLNKFLLSKYDCDVFMHTWSTIDHSTKTWHNHVFENRCDTVINRLEELRNIYRLKDILIENQVVEDIGTVELANDKVSISIFGIKSMFYSMQQSNRLRKLYQERNSVSYDYIVVVRPDILLKKDFEISKFVKLCTDEEISKSFFTASNKIGYAYSAESFGITDSLYFARPDVLDLIYENDKLFLDKFFNSGGKIERGPESFFIQMIKDLGIEVTLIEYFDGEYFRICRKKKNIVKKLFNLIKVDLLKV